MSELGCPKCGRTPVVYFVSSQKWVCRTCRHEWDKEKSKSENWDDKWGEQYVINPEVVARLRKKQDKVAKKPAVKKSGKTVEKKKPSAKKKRR
jgi:hypothetical protein